MTPQEQKELDTIRHIQTRLKNGATTYIQKNGLDAFLGLPAYENFTLNTGKYNRLKELELLELEDDLFTD